MPVALKLWFGEVPKQQQTRVVMVPSLNDNRGLLNKLMTTKFPASALLMEPFTCMKMMNVRTVVEWTPRECNQEADRLANGDTVGFNPALRLPVTSSSLHWYILEDALHAGPAAETEHHQAAAQIVAANRRGRSVRRGYVSLIRGEEI